MEGAGPVSLTSRLRELTRRPKVITAVLFIVLGFASFAAGFYATRYFTVPPNDRSNTDRLAIVGYAVLRAYHADGTLYQKWEGHNALDFRVPNGLAQCASGNNTTAPSTIARCAPWVNAIHIGGESGFYARKHAVNTLTPGGCDPTNLANLCSGWKTEATFSSEFAQAQTIVYVAGGDDIDCPPGVCFSTFDNFYPTPVTVNPGDSLTVTIDFTIA